MIYVIFGALVVGLSLGIFGSGGSILTVPVLVYLLHHPDKTAIAESLGIVGTIALVGAVPYAKDRLVNWRMVLIFGLPGMVGAFGGAWIAGYVPGFVQLIAFSVVMALAAIYMWRRSRPTSSHAPGAEPREDDDDLSTALAISQGLGVGAMTGFVGVGGGFLIVPALVLAGGLPMRRAVATSLVIIAMNSATGLLKHHHLLTDAGATPAWGVMGVFIALGVVGSLIGRHLQSRINQRLLQRGFAVFLVLMSAFILAKEITTQLAPGARTDPTEETES